MYADGFDRVVKYSMLPSICSAKQDNDASMKLPLCVRPIRHTCAAQGWARDRSC